MCGSLYVAHTLHFLNNLLNGLIPFFALNPSFRNGTGFISKENEGSNRSKLKVMMHAMNQIISLMSNCKIPLKTMLHLLYRPAYIVVGCFRFIEYIRAY